MSSELTDKENRLFQYLRSFGSPRVELDIDEASTKLSMGVEELAEALVSLIEKGYIRPEKLPPLPPLRRYVERRLLQLEADWVLRFARGACHPAGERADMTVLPRPILELLQSDRWPMGIAEVSLHRSYIEEWRSTVALLDDPKFPNEFPPLLCDPKPLLICVAMMTIYLLRLKESKGRVSERAYDMLLNEYNETITLVAKLLHRYAAAAGLAVDELSKELEKRLRALEAMKLDEAIRGISRKREIEELTQDILRTQSELSALTALFAFDKIVESLSAKVNELNRMMYEMKTSYELIQARYQIEDDASLKKKLEELGYQLESASNKKRLYSAILEVLTGSEGGKGSAEVLTTLTQTLARLRGEGLLHEDSWNAIAVAFNAMKETFGKLNRFTK